MKVDMADEKRSIAILYGLPKHYEILINAFHALGGDNKGSILELANSRLAQKGY